MSDFQAQINKLVEQFVSQITAVARDAAMQTLQAALVAANRVANEATRRTASTPTTTTTAHGLPRLASPTTSRAKGEKSTRRRLGEFIERNPGLRVEEINTALGTTTRDVALPLRKLIAEGVIRSEGEKRSTQYFPAGGRSATTTSMLAPVRRRRA